MHSARHFSPNIYHLSLHLIDWWQQLVPHIITPALCLGCVFVKHAAHLCSCLRQPSVQRQSAYQCSLFNQSRTRLDKTWQLLVILNLHVFWFCKTLTGETTAFSNSRKVFHETRLSDYKLTNFHILQWQASCWNALLWAWLCLTDTEHITPPHYVFEAPLPVSSAALLLLCWLLMCWVISLRLLPMKPHCTHV